ncbi:GGDEF domain-containing protein [Streptomyces sp. NBC_00648]|uniref:GGDEF domain-containing protein n=1 Tax=Streptomyces sp. NBC_00648 TaxID=2975797 RepID=UPI00324392FD
MVSNPSRPAGLVRIAALVTAAAIPAASWSIHTVIWRRRLAAAQRDALTRTLRRDGWSARAQHLIDRHGDQMLVLVCDVDHLKSLNDTYGHTVGDAVLAATAARLAAWTGGHGTVGRLGGDEFAAAVRVGAGQRDARLHQLTHALRAPVTADGVRVAVSVSVGAAAPGALGTRDLSSLLRAADAAMYSGKHTGTAVQAWPRHAAPSTPVPASS